MEEDREKRRWGEGETFHSRKPKTENQIRMFP
jgi:hypothetical protein